MDWLEYVKRDEPECAVLPQNILQRAEHIEPVTLDELLKEVDAKELSPTHLRMLMSLRRKWARWLTKCDEAQQKEQDIAPELWALCSHPSDLAFFPRFKKLLSMAERPLGADAWRAGLKLWQGCFQLAWKESTLRCKGKDAKHPRFSHYSDVIGRQDELETLPAHRWLAARRGEQEGVLSIQFDHPVNKMEQQVTLYRTEFQSVVQDRDDHSILQELVLDDIDRWLKYKLDELAREGAIEAAAKSYRGLLEQPDFTEKPIAAIFIGNEKARIGAVWLNAEGQCTYQENLLSSENTHKTLLRLLKDRPVDDIVMPLRASGMQRLRQIEQALHHQYDIHRVREAGIALARENWMSGAYRYPREIASAIALGRRFQQPLKEWSRIDPIKLGLGEYQELLDEEDLRLALKDEIAICSSITCHQAPKVTNIANTTSKKRNPLVKQFEDLRPGMTLQGIVANLTDFGAFVHIGLPEEGLVHLSELADRFVRHPSEVVQVGKEVNVRVLSADRKTRRISLTMREQDKPRRKSRQQQKSQALQNLENLFKK